MRRRRRRSEGYFWGELADNYLEMAKARLYDAARPQHEAARYTLHAALLAVVKLFAPFLPHVTEAIYWGSSRRRRAVARMHRSPWPEANPWMIDEAAERAGEALVAIATAVRRYKSEANLSLGAELANLELMTPSAELAGAVWAAEVDLKSVTRARNVVVLEGEAVGGAGIETPLGTIAVHIAR